KAACMRHANAANHHMIALAKGVDVVAGAGPDIAKHGAEPGLLADKVFWRRQFHVGNIAFKCCHRQSRPFRKRRIVGEIASRLSCRAAEGTWDTFLPERPRVVPG